MDYLKENMEYDEEDNKKKKHSSSMLTAPSNFLPNPQNTSIETNQTQTHTQPQQFQQTQTTQQSMPRLSMNEPMASNDVITIGGGGYMLY